MVRKLVVLLSSVLFISTQVTADTNNDVINFDLNSAEVKFSYAKDHNEVLSNYCRANPYETTAVQFNKTDKKHVYLYGIVFNAPFLTPNYSYFYRYTHQSYKKINNTPISLPTIKNCPNDISETKSYLEEVFYGDFNGDNEQDILFIPKHHSINGKAYVFNSFKISELNLKFYLPPSKLFELVDRDNFTSLKDISYLFNGKASSYNITIQDRNKDGRDDLLITRPGAPDLIAFAAPDGSFPKAEVDTGIGKYNGPSLYKSQFCNRALLTQHPDENPSTVLFDDICRTAYVSPPATGTTEVTALTPDPDNAAFCPKLATAQTNQTELLKELGQANTKFKTIMGSLPHDTQLVAYTDKREQAFNDLLAAEQAEAAVRKTVLSQRRAIGQLELDVEDCALLGTDCNTAQLQLNAAQQALTQLLTELDAAVEARLVKQQVYDQAYDTYGEALDAYLTVDTELAALIEEFKALQDKELALYREFAGLEGATAQIQYQWDWAEQVNRYQALNQSLKMQWQPLPVTGAKILAELQEKPETPLGDKAITLPAVLYTSIDDQAANVKINGYETALMPKGDAVITSTLRKEPSNPISLPSKINGTVGLSLAGYCPFAPSANQPQPIENLAAHLTPHIQYEYEEQIKRGYTAKYKLDTFVKTIVRTKKKKKWFKKKKKTYIERKVITSDWFNIQFDATSGEYAYSPAEQDQITREVKSDLVRRVNTAIGALYADNSQCQQNKDCSYGYWLGQLTGNNDDTKAIQQFKQGNSKWVEETVYGIRYRPKTGWVGFR
ncbi:hypothetical protein [Spartinivicinus ruber]|uniref:hypothetical protein n=1 Tax=Spartinivicinus ruber TaxID=2683272 RepID=UPI0013D51C95|nr:hypothetical protein [Spartinivicinus ruber]